MLRREAETAFSPLKQAGYCTPTCFNIHAIAFSPLNGLIPPSSEISNQSTWVLYELMCWLSLVVRSPPARRSLSWIQSTVD